MILLVFFLGILIAPLAIFIEYYAIKLIDFSPLGVAATLALEAFIAVSLTEEFLKYGAVRFTILKSPEFDEPFDAMLYLIVAALGFAAAENVLTFLSLESIEQIAFIGVLRFWGATFLHTLASGIIGYYLALSMRSCNSSESSHPKRLILKGFAIAVGIHGIYDYILFSGNGYAAMAIPFIMLISAGLVFRQIKILKNKLSTCDL